MTATNKDALPISHPNDQAATVEVPTIKRRLLCMMYESICVIAVLFLGSLPIAMIYGFATEGTRHAANQLYLLVLLGTYFTWFWVRGGQTLAMRTWRIRIVAKDGRLLTLPQSVKRYVVVALFILPALITLVVFSKYRSKVPWALFACVPMIATFLWARFDRERQFLHDRLAGSKQIMTRIVSTQSSDKE
jgi:uncharacterized RDD family membrane protein YckC